MDQLDPSDTVMSLPPAVEIQGRGRAPVCGLRNNFQKTSNFQSLALALDLAETDRTHGHQGEPWPNWPS